MSNTATAWNRSETLAKLAAAEQSGSITGSAATNIRIWLTGSKYAADAPEVAAHIDAGQWKTLDDVFWTTIPFGTGGRRGRMYPIGCNAINRQTIGESAQGLASYVQSTKSTGPWSAAVAYDTRHRSREFAELCAGVLVANGFTVFFIDDYRSTPELSFLIRYKQCDCGIMVTASHNPPSDNAVKVYWSNGAQLVPPHDHGVIEHVGQVAKIEVAEFERSVDDGKIQLCRAEVDRALLARHLEYRSPGPRTIRVIYSPLHGVGEFNVKTLLEADDFRDVEVFEPHRQPDGDFPNVPGHVSNPENPRVFDSIIDRAKATEADLILATDPDCDRMGAAAPLTSDSQGPWATFNGNQLSSLLAEFVLRKRQKLGRLTPENYVVTTLVTTPLVKRIAESYGVQCFDQNLVGFKWICNLMDQLGPEKFVYGTEESHGFLIGDYCRDKDGAIACMLMSELAAEAAADGVSVHQQLDQQYETFGLHVERLLTIRMEGSDGMRRMQQLMDRLRQAPPRLLAGMPVAATRDYLHGRHRRFDAGDAPMSGPKDNLIMLDTEQVGNYVAVRPSGTEPKVKFYLFAYKPADELRNLAEEKRSLKSRLSAIEKDLEAFADSI